MIAKDVLDAVSEMISKVEREDAGDVVRWLMEYHEKDPRPSFDDVKAMAKKAQGLLEDPQQQEHFAKELWAASAGISSLLKDHPSVARLVAPIVHLVPAFAIKLSAFDGIYSCLLVQTTSDFRDCAEFVLNAMISPDGKLDLRQVDKMVTEGVPWIAKTLISAYSNDFTKIILRRLTARSRSGAKGAMNLAAQVYMKMIEKEVNPTWKWRWEGFSTPKPEWSLDDIVFASRNDHINGTCYFPPEIELLYNWYQLAVGKKLEDAFKNDVGKPFMPSLVEVAGVCQLHGPPDQVLKALATHLEREIRRADRNIKRLVDEDVSKQTTQSENRRRARLTKAYDMLRLPPPKLQKQFQAIWAPILPPAAAPATPPEAPHAALHAPPTMPVVTSPPPVVSSTPQPPSLDEYLARHIQPRTDCDKCEVARGPDASVRSLFGSEGGSGRLRNIALKRACPVATHAISAAVDGVPLLDKYERDYGKKVSSKKQKVCDFMERIYGVERLGQPPSYKVTLYTPPRVGASISLEGGNIKLKLSAFGYEPTTEQGSKDNYMGFAVV